MSSLITYAYTVLKERPYLRWTGFFCLVVCIIFGLSCLKLQEDITQFIPESDQHLAKDMELLQKLPAQQQVMITLYKESDTVSSVTLAKATTDFAESLPQSLFDKVLSTPPLASEFTSKNLLALVPALFTAEYAQDLQARLSRPSLRNSLQKIIEKSMGLDGISQAYNLATDPLEISNLALHKIGSLSQIKNIRIRHGVFMNPDETASLIIAKTNITTTDSRGASQLQKTLDKLQGSLPTGIKASMVASQLYTAANAQAIQRDIFTVSCIGLIGLIILMYVFLRTRHIFILFTIPLCAYAAGGAALGIFCDPASAMTFGFGPVLLGITIDFALHLYYVVTTRDKSSYQEALSLAARPICLSGITTILAFALLLFSSVAGVRQLSIFVVTGLIIALGLALFFLPPFLRNSTTRPPTITLPTLFTETRGKRALIIAWLCVSFGAVIFLPKVHFQQSLQSMGIQVPHLLDAEQKFHSTWGSSPSSTLLFSFGDSFEEALLHSETAQELLQNTSAPAPTTLTALIPPPARQKQNIERWNHFWEKNRDVVEQRLHEEAETLGFQETAFSPFFDFLKAIPQETTLPMFTPLGLDEIIEQLVITPTTKGDNRYTILALYPQKVALDTVLQTELSVLQSHLITPADFGNNVGSTLSSSFAILFLCALLIIIVVIALLLQKFKATFCAILPALWGLLIMAATLGALNIPLGLFSLAGALLVLGHGVDYGIYMIHQNGHSAEGVTTAIFVSGLASLIGFGALSFAQHPALYSMGVSVFSGVLAAMLCALFVVPSFLGEKN